MLKHKKKSSIISIILITLSLIGLILTSYSSPIKLRKNYSYFLSDMKEHLIDKVDISSTSSLGIYLKDGSSYKVTNPNSPNIKEDLLKNNITIIDRKNSPIKSICALILIGAIFYLIFSFLKEKEKTGDSKTAFEFKDYSKSADKLSFKDFAGNEEAKENLNEIVSFLKNPELFENYGARLPKGVILYGPPGTGKTLLAKAVAGEAKVPFYALNGSDFMQVYVGVGASRVRNLFKRAKSHGKAVIFIDEIDAIGKKRGASANSSDEKDQTLNALLTEMSGFGEKEGIVVIAATNRLDILDTALLRPGRFDRHIEIGLPDIAAREQIIKHHLKNKPYKDLDIEDIARNTSYFSGAKIENLLNEAAIIASKDRKKFIDNNHIKKAFFTILAGTEKINRSSITKDDMLITAYHESGHAILSYILLPQEELSKISIIPTTKGTGGYTYSIPKESPYQRKDYLKMKIIVGLGGRAAEEILLGKDNITTGASNDLELVTRISQEMICEYGMGETLGLLKLSTLGSLGSSHSEAILLECKNLVNSLYNDALNLLLKNKDYLDKLSKALLEKESLDKKEILSILKD